MNLLVDLGNSRLKWAEHSAGAWRTGVLSIRAREPRVVFDEAWSVIEAPRRILVSCVAGTVWRESLERWAASRGHVKPEFARSLPEQFGVRNAYRDSSQLGVDRWLALIAARGLTASNACVVDCGTAVTIDALAANGEFLGGLIFPGLDLLRSSLAHGTEAIGADTGDEENCLARSTADAVAAGTLHGLAGAIERVLHEQQRTLGGSVEVFITGGDAPRVMPLMPGPCIHVPDLVLKGLARIAEAAA